MSVGLIRRRDDNLRESWNDRASGWHEHVAETDGFRRIRAALLDAAGPRPTDVAVDLGAGSGFVTLPLARLVTSVLAVDISSAMLDVLEEAAWDEQLPVRTQTADLASLDLPDRSVDLVVSSYALHHLADDEKAALVRRAHRWLREGGRLVIADMMIGRGLSGRDRTIARRKAAALLRKGPGGVWRIVKNVVRFSMRVGMEQPASPDAWVEMLRAAGFRDVRQQELLAEACLVVGRR